jgi:hypothetical protein
MAHQRGDPQTVAVRSPYRDDGAGREPGAVDQGPRRQLVAATRWTTPSGMPALKAVTPNV